MAYCISRCNRNCPGDDLIVRGDGDDGDDDGEEADSEEEEEEEEDDIVVLLLLLLMEEDTDTVVDIVSGVNRTRFKDRCKD